MIIFAIISNPPHRGTTNITLPADHEVLSDALGRIQSDGSVYARGHIHSDFGHNPTPFNFGVCNLHELNHLATHLSTLDFDGQGQFIGAYHLNRNHVTLPQTINIAYNVKQTELVEHHPANDAEELAEFYLENELIPEVKDLPDPAYRWMLDHIDFKRLGNEIKRQDNGVFIGGAYVVITGELEELYDGNFEPPTPEPVEEQRSGMTFGGMSL